MLTDVGPLVQVLIFQLVLFEDVDLSALHAVAATMPTAGAGGGGG